MIDDSNLLLVVGTHTDCYGASYAKENGIKVEQLLIPLT